MTNEAYRILDIGKQIAALTAEAKTLRNILFEKAGKPSYESPAKFALGVGFNGVLAENVMIVTIAESKDGKDVNVTFENLSFASE